MQPMTTQIGGDDVRDVRAICEHGVWVQAKSDGIVEVRKRGAQMKISTAPSMLSAIPIVLSICGVIFNAPGAKGRRPKPTCPFRKSYPDVLVVQSSQDGNGDRSLDRPMQGRIFP